MKVKIPVVLLLLIAGAVGFLLGTDAGRSQRDVILVKLGKKEGAGDAVTDAAADAVDAAKGAAEDAADAVADAAEAAGDAAADATSAS